jgi:hypothetical protein
LKRYRIADWLKITRLAKERGLQFIRDNNRCHGLTHNVKDFSLKKTWQKIYPEIQRLKSNWELSIF